MIPCKDCIAFAVCNSHDDKITCSLLYEYFIEGGIPVTDRRRQLQLGRLKEISTFFNRKVSSWYFGSSINNPNMTLYWVEIPRKLR